MGAYNLKRFRTDNNLKQSELADILGVKQAYVSEIEKGRKPLSKDAEEILSMRFSDFQSYRTDESEQEVSVVSKLIHVIKSQQENISKRDEQIDKLISLLEKAIENQISGSKK